MHAIVYVIVNGSVVGIYKCWR